MVSWFLRIEQLYQQEIITKFSDPEFTTLFGFVCFNKFYSTGRRVTELTARAVQSARSESTRWQQVLTLSMSLESGLLTSSVLILLS